VLGDERDTTRRDAVRSPLATVTSSARGARGSWREVARRNSIASVPLPAFLLDQLSRPSGRLAPVTALLLNSVNARTILAGVSALELRPGQRVVEVGFGGGLSLPFLLRAIGQHGQVFATDATCPHKGGPLADGMIGTRTLVCPLHGCGYDLETGAAVGHACGGVRSYPAIVNAQGEILVGVE